MTLVVGIIAKDGIVMASDSRMSSTISSNDTVKKIFRLDDHNVLGVSGDGTLGIHFLDLIINELSYKVGIVHLVEQFREKAKAKFNDYFEHQVPKDRPDLTFMIAGYTNDKEPQPKLYELKSTDNFVPRPSVTGFDCMGVPYFADYLLNRFYEKEINIDQAAVLAAFCVLETSSQHHGVGDEVKITSFSTIKGFAELPVPKIKEIINTCKELHKGNKSKFYPEV